MIVVSNKEPLSATLQSSYVLCEHWDKIMPRPTHQTLFDHQLTNYSPAHIIKTQIYSVSAAVALLNDILAPLTLTITGEISGFKISQGKFAFFDIKDESAVLNCFMMVFQLPFTLEDGMSVRITGLPKIRPANGRFGITVQSVELIGEGALQKAFEQLKSKLDSEGLFDQKWKKSLPLFPLSIGLITSKSGDALQDMLRIMRNQAGGLIIYLAPVAVQGQSATLEIISAVRWFNTNQPVDVVIIARGGGSLEDLQAFNAEPVARAIFASRLPIVTGVGHEPDVTLADLVADVRAATPTNAAEIVVPNFDELNNNLSHFQTRLSQATRGLIGAISYQTELMMHRLIIVLERPKTLLKTMSDRTNMLLQNRKHTVIIYQNELINMRRRMLHNIVERVRSTNLNLDQFESLLMAFDPLKVLNRGYAIVTKTDGLIVKSTSDVNINDVVSVQLSKGSILTEVRQINNERTSNA